jgi:hypothetical protein
MIASRSAPISQFYKGLGVKNHFERSQDENDRDAVTYCWYVLGGKPGSRSLRGVDVC